MIPKLATPIRQTFIGRKENTYEVISDINLLHFKNCQVPITHPILFSTHIKKTEHNVQIIFLMKCTVSDPHTNHVSAIYLIHIKVLKM